MPQNLRLTNDVFEVCEQSCSNSASMYRRWCWHRTRQWCWHRIQQWCWCWHRIDLNDGKSYWHVHHQEHGCWTNRIYGVDCCDGHCSTTTMPRRCSHESAMWCGILGNAFDGSSRRRCGGCGKRTSLVVVAAREDRAETAREMTYRPWCRRACR